MSSVEPVVRPAAGSPDVMPPDGLRAHWRIWLGASPTHVSRLGHPSRPDQHRHLVRVVSSDRREKPGWDGEVHPVAGVLGPNGNAVVSVPTGPDAWARQLLADGGDLDDLRAALPARLGLPDHQVYRAVYRWSTAPPPAAAVEPAGVWLPVSDARVPEWLQPFGGMVLVSLADDGTGYRGGVGLKRHDDLVHEIAVGTAETARGRGLARRLVAQAARELLAAGVVPTYMHDPANLASARVAAAAEFLDRGWSALGIATTTPDPVG